MRIRVLSTLAVFAIMLAALPRTAIGQTSTSSSMAKELVQELAKRQLTTVAAKDPEQADVYVAANYLPGIELIALSARSTSPPYLDSMLAAKRYDEVYGTLNQASVPDGKLFLQDMRADGLTPAPDKGASFDIAYQNVVKTILFNGDWKKQSMSEAEYRKTFEQVDARYTRILALLLQQLRADGQPVK